MKHSIVVIVGPTASGKTALAIALAERFRGEIVNADARQVYRYMDIGTAKPTIQEQARARHHLIDIRDPDRTFSLPEFLSEAVTAIGDITRRRGLPIIAGGTGQYVRALLEGWEAPAVPPDPALRSALLARAEADGGAALHGELARLDPVAATGIDARNVRRVVRALEVIATTGRPFSEQRARRQTPYRALVIGLHLERPALYEHIDRRVDAMYAAGLVDEVRRLQSLGFGCDLPAMSSIGYAEVCDLLTGRLTLTEAANRTKTATHRLARTQSNWFRRSDPSIHWLEAETPPVEEAVGLVERFREDDA